MGAPLVFDRIVYKTTNLLDGSIYIGQDSYNRDSYLGSGKILKRKIKELGKENFKKEILCKCTSSEELDEKEIYYIKKFNTIENGYNILKGGKGNSYLEYIENMKKTTNNRKNPMAGKSVLDIWIEKYGKEKASIMWEKSNLKRSINRLNKGIKKIKAYNLHNELVKEFNSIKEASEFTTVGYKYIKKSNKYNKPSKGYYFKY